MSFVTLAGLVKIELRGGATIRLGDGGFVNWAGELYQSADPVFGTIADVEPLSQGVGDEAPGARLSLNPASTAGAAVLAQPGYQGSRCRFWIAEIDDLTGQVSGTPTQLADLQIDAAKLIAGRGTRRLDLDCVSRAERFFIANEGNTLSPRFHKAMFPGELGEDNATGVGTNVAWGVAGARGVSTGPSFNFGGANLFDVLYAQP